MKWKEGTFMSLLITVSTLMMNILCIDKLLIGMTKGWWDDQCGKKCQFLWAIHNWDEITFTHVKFFFFATFCVSCHTWVMFESDTCKITLGECTLILSYCHLSRYHINFYDTHNMMSKYFLLFTRLFGLLLFCVSLHDNSALLLAMTMKWCHQS